eukprot:116876_1
MILFASYEQTATANGWNISSNEGIFRRRRGDDKDTYDFNGDNDEENKVEQDDVSLKDDFNDDNDEENDNKDEEDKDKVEKDMEVDDDNDQDKNNDQNGNGKHYNFLTSFLPMPFT